jgi:ArsR family transcriptional regulator, arsenate/arsenite/antimonite-responsive transcriptional repressor
MPSTAQSNLEERAEFFKALGHPMRLLIVNLVRTKPRHGEELALILGLNPATISHHLSLLTGAGLLSAHKDQYYQVYSLAEGVMHRTLSEWVDISPSGNLEGVEEDAFRRKVLQTFFKYGRLVSIPAQLKKRQVVLEKIAEGFEPGRRYSEREVNYILLDFHDDVAALRRGMVEAGLMQRDGGEYWKIPPP